MQKKIQKTFFDFEIIAFELVALNTPFYWEKILNIGCHMFTNNLKTSDTTKTESFELIFFQSDQKVCQKHYHGDLCSVSDTLTCSLSISALTRSFLSI